MHPAPLVHTPTPHSPGPATVDLFAGAGGLSLGAQYAGARLVASVNHWQRAVDTHALAFPDAQHFCEDAAVLNPLVLPEHSFLAAAPSCIPGDMLLVMWDGTERAASAVRIGDEVLTHMGRGRRVTNVWSKSYSGMVCNFVLHGDSKKACRTTAEHMVWVRRRGGHFSRLGEPRFVRADSVRAGDYVAFPRVPETVGTATAFVAARVPGRTTYVMQEHKVAAFTRRGTPIRTYTRCAHSSSLPGATVVLDGASRDLWWLIGHYLGDGQARRDRPHVGWSIGGSEENLRRVQEILRGVGLSWWLAGKPGNTTVFTSSAHLHAVCTAFGRLCDVKHIPAELARLELPYVEALLDGYLAADGCRRKRANPTWEATSISLAMLQGMQTMCWRLGWSASVCVAAHAKTAVIEGRTVWCQPQWSLRIVKTPSGPSRTKPSAGHIWRSVRKVQHTAVDALEVFDFEVDEDHTFCLPGMVVHNCTGHTRARGVEQPHHDAARATAWCVIRVAEPHRPRVIVCENVPELRRWECYRAWRMALNDLGYVLSETVLDAADCGVPQHRVRLFVVAVHRTVLGVRAGREADTPGVVIPAPSEPHVACRTVIDTDPIAGPHTAAWRPWRDLCTNTVNAIRAARWLHGDDAFLVPYYGASRDRGWSLDRPIGTLTTHDRYAVVVGDVMRMLSVDELTRLMGFPADYPLQGTRADRVKQIGNAVCPPAGAWVVSHALRAAGLLPSGVAS